MDGQDIAEKFLNHFIHSLAKAKNPSAQLNEIYQTNQLQESVLKQESQRANSIQMVPQFLKPIQIKKQPMINNSQRFAPQQNSNLRNNISQNRPAPSANEQLNRLIQDPSINEIELTDVDNPLLIKRSGMTQKTQVKLSIEDAYDLIAEFSQKTKIPVINGTIKAALNNLIITAVISESLGPRFIIQKKRQF